jgi:DNA-binding NarL/FixJ family response regulator
VNSVKKSKTKSTNPLSKKNNKILIVENERIIALDLQNILERYGFEVCCVVSSGEESIRAATHAHPDVVLMDVKLKGNMSGIEAAREIHENLDIPVVYLTAFSDELTVRNALEYRKFPFIRKPFEEREIEKTIRKTLKRSIRGESHRIA